MSKAGRPLKQPSDSRTGWPASCDLQPLRPAPNPAHRPRSTDCDDVGHRATGRNNSHPNRKIEPSNPPAKSTPPPIRNDRRQITDPKRTESGASPENSHSQRKPIKTRSMGLKKEPRANPHNDLCYHTKMRP